MFSLGRVLSEVSNALQLCYIKGRISNLRLKIVEQTRLDGRLKLKNMGGILQQGNGSIASLDTHRELYTIGGKRSLSSDSELQWSKNKTCLRNVDRGKF